MLTCSLEWLKEIYPKPLSSESRAALERDLKIALEMLDVIKHGPSFQGISHYRQVATTIKSYLDE